MQGLQSACWAACLCHTARACVTQLVMQLVAATSCIITRPSHLSHGSHSSGLLTRPGTCRALEPEEPVPVPGHVLALADLEVRCALLDALVAAPDTLGPEQLSCHETRGLRWGGGRLRGGACLVALPCILHAACSLRDM